MPLEAWQLIKNQNPNPCGYSGLAGTDAFDTFHRNTIAFADILPGIVDSISAEAQKFYDRHFSAGEPAKVTLKLGVTTLPSSSGGNQQTFQFIKPIVEFGIQVAGKVVNRPQAFLNEAKLTQLALSVRFAASLVNLHESDLKLLVLDDLLVSLDMSNRMKVAEILLTNPALANYQKIILTHDLGFFREFRRTIGPAIPTGVSSAWWAAPQLLSPAKQRKPNCKKLKTTSTATNSTKPPSAYAKPLKTWPSVIANGQLKPNCLQVSSSR